MRPGQQNKRPRGRNNNNNGGGGRRPSNPLSRSYESNGPDVKVRGSAQHVAEKYTTLARDSASSGDRVMAENYLQHAEHYNRIVAAAQAAMQERQQRDDSQNRDGRQDDSRRGSDESGQDNSDHSSGQNGSGQSGSGERHYDRNQDQGSDRGNRGRSDGGDSPRSSQRNEANNESADGSGPQPVMDAGTPSSQERPDDVQGEDAPRARRPRRRSQPSVDAGAEPAVEAAASRRRAPAKRAPAGEPDGQESSSGSTDMPDLAATGSDG